MVLRRSSVRSAYFIIIIYRTVYILLPQESDYSFSPPHHTTENDYLSLSFIGESPRACTYVYPGIGHECGAGV